MASARLSYIVMMDRKNLKYSTTAESVASIKSQKGRFEVCEDLISPLVSGADEELDRKLFGSSPKERKPADLFDIMKNSIEFPEDYDEKRSDSSLALSSSRSVFQKGRFQVFVSEFAEEDVDGLSSEDEERDNEENEEVHQPSRKRSNVTEFPEQVSNELTKQNLAKDVKKKGLRRRNKSVTLVTDSNTGRVAISSDLRESPLLLDALQILTALQYKLKSLMEENEKLKLDNALKLERNCLLRKKIQTSLGN
jgi:hypothetical protein